jgi:hypothetical protein
MIGLPGPAETPAAANEGSARHGTASQPRATAPCPECGELFDRVHPRQLFCTGDHKQTFANRIVVRGKMLVPLDMAQRITRGGSRGDIATGRRARQDREMLLDRWAAEDREAGRMSMVDYMALRYALGFGLA